MAIDVSDGPAWPEIGSWSERRLDLCLKRPSFYCLIHFYKRCVSSLALSLEFAWVDCLVKDLLSSGLMKVH